MHRGQHEWKDNYPHTWLEAFCSWFCDWAHSLMQFHHCCPRPTNLIRNHSQNQNLIQSQRTLNFFAFWIHSSQIHHYLSPKKDYHHLKISDSTALLICTNGVDGGGGLSCSQRAQKVYCESVRNKPHQIHYLRSFVSASAAAAEAVVSWA